MKPANPQPLDSKIIKYMGTPYDPEDTLTYELFWWEIKSFDGIRMSFLANGTHWDQTTSEWSRIYEEWQAARKDATLVELEYLSFETRRALIPALARIKPLLNGAVIVKGPHEQPHRKAAGTLLSMMELLKDERIFMGIDLALEPAVTMLTLMRDGKITLCEPYVKIEKGQVWKARDAGDKTEIWRVDAITEQQVALKSMVMSMTDDGPQFRTVGAPIILPEFEFRERMKLISSASPNEWPHKCWVTETPCLEEATASIGVGPNTGEPCFWRCHNCGAGRSTNGSGRVE